MICPHSDSGIERFLKDGMVEVPRHHGNILH